MFSCRGLGRELGRLETVLLRTCRYSDVPGFTRLGFSLNYLEAVFLRVPDQMHESPFCKALR